MAFDADAYLEALEPPTIKVGGTTYVGKFLSIEEWLPFEDRFRKIDGDTEYPVIKRLMRDYCSQAFPVPWYQLLNFKKKIVGELVTDLPPKAMLQAMRDFFKAQARALSVVSEGPPELEEKLTPEASQ